MRSSSAAIVFWLGLAGCLDLRAPPTAPRDARVDAPAAPAVVGIEVLDADGRAHEHDAIPRRPTIRVVTNVAITNASDSVLLLSGADDPELRADLASAPLRESTLARAIAEPVADRGAVALSPATLLPPGARVVLVIAPWARDGSGRALGTTTVVPMRVDDDPLAGAQALEAWPPDGAFGIGPALALAGVRFDGAVRGVEDGVWLEDARGARVPATARGARCDEIGWEGAHCAVVVPSRALAPGEEHAIRVGGALRDGVGGALRAWSSRFVTARDPDLGPPRPTPPECARDETAIEIGCALADDARIVLRARFAEPTRLRVVTPRSISYAVAPRGEATIAIDALAAGVDVPVAVDALDAAGNGARFELALATTEPLPTLSITELLADPRGPEPQQEHVEVHNYGERPIDLEGFALADHPESEGDVISGSHVVPPGARVLIVGADFDASSPDGDPAIPPGATLVRVDRSLGSGGLSNAGEPLFLRDPEGRRISAAPAIPPPREGVCIARRSGVDPRTGAAGSFDYDGAGSCSPGR
jgi:hypothetical protein